MPTTAIIVSLVIHIDQHPEHGALHPQHGNQNNRKPCGSKMSDQRINHGEQAITAPAPQTKAPGTTPGASIVVIGSALACRFHHISAGRIERACLFQNSKRVPVIGQAPRQFAA